MKKPAIFRKRYIPHEIVDISSDELLFRSDRVLVTRWTTIRPRDDFASGVSFTFLDKGYKISRFYNAEGVFLYWYCDIIDVEHDKSGDIFTLNDLLVDVKVMPDGRAVILDTDELAEAVEKGMIGTKQVVHALRALSELLAMIYGNVFPPPECFVYYPVLLHENNK